MTDRDDEPGGIAPDDWTPAEPSGSAADEPSSLESTARDVPDETSGPSRAPHRFTGRGAVVVGVRGLIGIIGGTVAATAVVAATVITGPIHTTTPPSASIAPVPTAQERVCPGPLLRLGDDAGQAATVATAVGDADVVFESVPAEATADRLPTTDNPSGLAPQVLVLPPGQPGGRPLLAGSQSQAVTSGGLLGLAAAECVEASGDSWLVGGATDVGRTTLITISNPSSVIATVALSIYGQSGPVAASGAEGIVVPPGSQRIISLAAFAPEIVAPVVRVESRGGQVVANLQQSIVRTLAPGGVEIIGETSGPSRNVVIPGLVVASAESVAEIQTEPGYMDVETVVRVLLPGDAPTTATVTVTPERGEVDPTVFDLELVGGEVGQVGLGALDDGNYTVTVEADLPVVAGVRVSTVTDDGTADFSWLGAPEALGDRALLVIAPGPSPRLHLANPTAADVTVTVESGGETRSIRVPAGRSVSTPIARDDVVLTGTTGLIANVSYTGDGELAAFGVTTPGPGATPITVYR